MRNKKLKKALIIILAILGVAVLVLYAIFPTQTKQYITYFYGVLNEPLPILGVSILALGFIVYRCIKYIRDTHPSQQLKEMKSQYDEYVEKSDEEKEHLKEENTKLKGYIVHICELSTNQKIKNYGKELLGYGEETIDSETKAE